MDGQRFSSLLFAGCLALLSPFLPAPAAAQSGDPSFEVINRAPVTIRNIYVSSVDAGNWGNDWLPSNQVLPSGQKFRVSPPRGTCMFDVRVVYTNEQSEERRRQNLCQISEIVFTGPSGSASAPASPSTANADFDLVNRSSKTITQLFLSRPESNSWGQDRLPGTVAAGNKYSVRMPRDGQCEYDVRVVYADSSSEERRRQNLCSVSELAFSGAAAASPSSSPPSASTRNPDFDVVNGSSLTITQLYVSPAQTDKWGEDKLPGTLAAGGRFKVTLPRDGSCQYDVRVIYQDKSTEERRGQNVCALMEIAFNGASRTSAASSPERQPQTPPAAPQAPRGPSFGTGFFVSPQGYALTNNHVTDNCRSVSVVLDGQQVPAQLVRRDERNDLALLRVQVPGTVPFARFRASPSIKTGEGVMVAGFPLPTVLQNGLNITLGNVSALAGLGGNTALIQVTAPVQPGNSGGPLLDMGGNLVGVVVSKLDAMRLAQSTGDIPQNINFAVQGAVARLFLEAGGQHVEERPSAKELRVGEVSDRAREFTFQVECRP
jgi:serine protease Do